MHRNLVGCSLVVVAFALAACGGSDDAAIGTTSGSGGAAATSSTTGAGGGSTSATTGAGGQIEALAEVGTYVVLGDSISDHGGESPFFYDLLAQNDDAVHPTWAGKDLKTKYGAGLAVVSNAKGGAVSKDLPAQVSALPATLTGPVVVTITIGGNDMQKYVADILQGQDEGDRAKFKENLDAAVGELLTPGRFGEGVEVHVFEANIYDPTDGVGDFKDQKCPFPLSLLPTTPTDEFFANWNAVVSDSVPALGGHVEAMHERFYGHGLAQGDESWYVGDCIHPSRRGHHEIRSMFWTAITGEVIP